MEISLAPAGTTARAGPENRSTGGLNNRGCAHPRLRSQRPSTLCPRKPLGIICRPPTLAYTFGQLEPSSAIPARHLSSTPGSANASGPGNRERVRQTDRERERERERERPGAPPQWLRMNVLRQSQRGIQPVRPPQQKVRCNAAQHECAIRYRSDDNYASYTLG